ncbi:MAG: periplasmic heavy metal sensor [Spirochaetes bacterium]|nr:periplasmic heavy metal sensor [Spirochaetota bacterium]
MKKGIQLAVAVAVAIALAQPALYAQKGKRQAPARNDRGKMHMMEKGCPIFGDPVWMKKELGLNDDQVKKIAEINKKHQLESLDYREKLAPKNIQLKKLLLEENVNMGKVRALLKEIADIRVEMQVLRIEHRLAIEKVLTADQKEKMRSFRRHMMRGDRMHRSGGSRGPDGPDDM